LEKGRDRLRGARKEKSNRGRVGGAEWERSRGRGHATAKEGAGGVEIEVLEKSCYQKGNYKLWGKHWYGHIRKVEHCGNMGEHFGVSIKGKLILEVIGSLCRIPLDSS